MNQEREILVQDKQKTLANIKLRIISAIFILFIFLFGLIYNKYFFTVLMFCVFIGMMMEWYLMTNKSRFYLLIGFLMFSLSCGSLVISRFIEQNHIPVMMYFIIIWTVDTMALVGGKTIGGLKLAPKISPNKTWSGLIIGAISSGIMASLLTYLPNYDFSVFSKIGVSSLKTTFIFAIFLGIISQMSDLFMSFFKRKFNIKDSGNIIPGHGGMIDRFDSIVLTAPIILYILL